MNYDDFVLKQVLWGEPKKAIIARLKTNGIPIKQAEEIYHKAIQARISTIRSFYWPKFWKGIITMSLGSSIFCALWWLTESFTVWSSKAVILPILLFGYGVFQFGNGLAGILTAPSRTGSIADMQ